MKTRTKEERIEIMKLVIKGLRQIRDGARLARPWNDYGMSKIEGDAERLYLEAVTDLGKLVAGDPDEESIARGYDAQGFDLVKAFHPAGVCYCPAHSHCLQAKTKPTGPPDPPPPPPGRKVG